MAALGEARAAKSPKQIVLRSSEIPMGFKQTKGHFISNTQDAKTSHVSVGTLNRKGRITAYEEEFDRAAARGMTLIENEVDVFKSSSGAHWEYSRSLANLRHQIGKSKLHPMSIGHIGDQSIAFTVREKSGGTNVTLVLVAFRHGQYDSEVTIGGTTGTFSPQPAVRYLQIVDGRT